MNKTDLINALVEETTLNKRDVVRVLETLTRVVERTLKKGGKVQWSKFGTFQVNRRPSRIGVNPATKEKIQLPESVVTKFRPSKHMKDAMKSLLS